jgi:DNA-binding transcriptional ArsR family regulator
VVVRIRLTGTALARVRFAISPVFETVMAVDALRRPGAHAVHQPWLSWARSRLGDRAVDLPNLDRPDLGLLLGLLDAEAKPSYLMPIPDDRMPDLPTELRRMRSTVAAQVQRDLDRRKGPLPRPLRDLRADPRAGLARLVATIQAVHDALLAPYWPRMVRLLEADIAVRAAMLADEGSEAVFAGLHRDIDWSDGELVLHAGRRPENPTMVDVAGHGLILSPSVFAWPNTWTETRPARAGILRYPARGIATVWEERPAAPDAIAALIGRTRAELLELLAAPATTGGLAGRLGITAGAVSQHLNVLRAAGLVATRRDGRAVMHFRTTRGDALVNRQEATDAPGRRF